MGWSRVVCLNGKGFNRCVNKAFAQLRPLSHSLQMRKSQANCTLLDIINIDMKNSFDGNNIPTFNHPNTPIVFEMQRLNNCYSMISSFISCHDIFMAFYYSMMCHRVFHLPSFSFACCNLINEYKSDSIIKRQI